MGCDSGLPAVTVLIPSLGLGARAALLQRALESVRTQEGVCARACVIINGAEADPVQLSNLRMDPTLDLLEIPTRGIPDAFRAGQARATAPYLTALDDDDEFLPGALALRVWHLETHPHHDAVVTNGLVRTSRGDRLLRDRFSDVAQDPLREMLRHNWLLPGAWLCRNARLGAWLFEGMPAHRECTWIGLRLATGAGVQVGYLDTPTVIWYEETAGSTHRSAEHRLGQVAALRQLLTLPLPADVREQFRMKMAGANHDIADHLLFREARWWDAWQWHVRSLRAPGGMRHLAFTRKFLWPDYWRHREVRRRGGQRA